MSRVHKPESKHCQRMSGTTPHQGRLSSQPTHHPLMLQSPKYKVQSVVFMPQTQLSSCLTTLGALPQGSSPHGHCKVQTSTFTLTITIRKKLIIPWRRLIQFQLKTSFHGDSEFTHTKCLLRQFPQNMRQFPHKMPSDELAEFLTPLGGVEIPRDRT